MSERIRGFMPHIGIEYIDELPRDTLQLPVDRGAELTGGQIRDRLDELYPDSEVERRLRELAAPRLNDPAILVPVRFETLLRGALEALRADAEARGVESDSPLERLLSEEMSLRADLAAMRATLLRA
mgnify:CR=1 FL=1